MEDILSNSRHASWRPPIDEDLVAKDDSFLMIIFLSKVVAVKLLSEVNH